MAGGTIFRPPYQAAFALAAWAAERWEYVDGRLALAGLQLEGMPFSRLLNVIYALVVDEPNGLINREEVRAAIELGIEKATPDREHWGTTKRAQEGQAAMMQLFPKGGA